MTKDKKGGALNAFRLPILLAVLATNSIVQTVFSADLSINDIINSKEALRIVAGNTYTYTFTSLRGASTTDPTTYTYWGFGNFPEDRVVLGSSSSDPLSISEDSWTVKMYVQQENHPIGYYSLFYSADNNVLNSNVSTWGSAIGGKFLSQGGYPVDRGGKVEITMNIGSADITFLSVGAIAAMNELYFLSKDYTFPIVPIPEPSSLSLLALGAVVVALRQRKKE